MPVEPAPPSGSPEGGSALATNRKATFSVILGAAAFVTAFLNPFFAFVLAVPSVTCGVHARREINAAKGTEIGDMTAVIGLTMGATTLGLLLLSSIADNLL